MPLRNGEHGYGSVSKALHWLTVVALLAQLGIGLTMDADAAAERAEETAETREDAAKDAAEDAEDRAPTQAEDERADRDGEQAEEAADAAADQAADTEYRVGPGDGIDLLDVHVGLGVGLLLLGIARVVWRRVGGLPPWSEALSAGERTLATWTEKVLLGCLFLVPLSGLALVLTQDDGYLPAHIAAQLLLGLAVAAHLALVLRHTLLRRDRLLQRMLPTRGQ